MSEWKEYKLGEVCSRLRSGKNLKSNSIFPEGKYPVWGGNGIRGYTSESNFKGKCCIIGRQGAYCGNVHFFDGEAYMTEHAIVAVGNELADTYYLSCALSLMHLENLSAQSAQPGISVQTLAKQVLSLPPIEEQRRIAGVLSSLDDKIDLLNRENATLEALAETLFRHHFIENPDPIWKEMPVSYYGKVICGKTPSKKNTEYFGGEVPFIKIPDMHGNTYVFNSEDSLSEKGRISQREKTLPKDSIMVSCIATVGLVSMNAYEAQTNQQINSVVPYDEHYRYYLYCWLNSMYDELNTMASGGTATLNLNTGDFSRIGIPLPDETAIKEFHLQVEPLFAKIKSNQQQMQILATQRDILLPRLMTHNVQIVE